MRKSLYLIILIRESIPSQQRQLKNPKMEQMFESENSGWMKCLKTWYTHTTEFACLVVSSLLVFMKSRQFWWPWQNISKFIWPYHESESFCELKTISRVNSKLFESCNSASFLWTSTKNKCSVTNVFVFLLVHDQRTCLFCCFGFLNH